jgi:ribokinase
MTQAQILSLGSVNVDFQVHTDRWPEPGETLLGQDFLMIGGGKGANVAFLACRLGVNARLLARVGEDALAEEALRPLREVGVDLGATKHVAGEQTGVALITVRPEGDKGIILAANANAAWTPTDAEEVATAVRDAPPGSVLVADLEVPASIVQRALETARQHGLRAVLDPSPAGRLIPALYPAVDYLTPNPAEAEQLTNMPVRSVEDAFRAGEVLLERGVGAALMKLGAGGCVVVSAGMREHLPAVPVRVVDQTGAGDAFAGALAVALLEGQQVNEAARFAVAAATLAVTRYGSQPSYPTRAELERWIAQGDQALDKGERR